MGGDRHDEMPEPVGDPAKEETPGEPAGGDDLQKIRDDIVKLRDDLSDIREQGEGAL